MPTASNSGSATSCATLPLLIYNQVTPVFDLLHIDSDERTWVRLVGPRFAPTATWLVYDRDGGPLGAVTTPAGFRFLDARGSRLLVVRLDALDVPLVEVWEVRWR